MNFDNVMVAIDEGDWLGQCGPLITQEDGSAESGDRFQEDNVPDHYDLIIIDDGQFGVQPITQIETQFLSLQLMHCIYSQLSFLAEIFKDFLM